MVKQNEAVAHKELVGGEETNLHSHPGGGNGPSKHMDAGTHTMVTSKGWEPVVFHSTFPTVPVVVVSTQTSGNVGKKTGVKSVTTTGFDIYSEATGDVVWIAREEGYE